MDLKRIFYLLCCCLCLPVTTWAFDDFDCVGSEPFWKLSITEKKITFTQQTNSPVTMPSAEPKPAENMSMEHIRIFRSKLSDKDTIIVIQKQSCTDGMSEDVFQYEGLFISSDKVFHGCCSKKIVVTN